MPKKKKPEQEKSLNPHQLVPVHNRKAAYLLILLGSILLLFSFHFIITTFKIFLLPQPNISRTTDVSLIQEWMSLPYISKAYRIPEPELLKALNLEPQHYRGTSIKAIADSEGKTAEELLAILRQKITEHQSTHPAPKRKELPWTKY